MTDSSSFHNKYGLNSHSIIGSCGSFWIALGSVSSPTNGTYRQVPEHKMASSKKSHVRTCMPGDKVIIDKLRDIWDSLSGAGSDLLDIIIGEKKLEDTTEWIRMRRVTHSSHSSNGGSIKRYKMNAESAKHPRDKSYDVTLQQVSDSTHSVQEHSNSVQTGDYAQSPETL